MPDTRRAPWWALARGSQAQDGQHGENREEDRSLLPAHNNLSTISLPVAGHPFRLQAQ